ncbi:hypothetical protein BSZ14_14790 [Sphingomonas sp. Sph1(2015)]|jgi:chromosome segregation ATPase|uniref:hypothetical protein n=1 Tax=Sphingomonas sp. Sph1(2015) TaxID=1628084 RepID=UPI000978CF88|nr:hypothetical protein [Sphingomonas sp. Sph1(2015)]OMJ31169.1 hypothetical protein BSZ14_14790 [Sphingomonas sp. Sph1(2015)]
MSRALKKVFGRRPDDGERWALNGREITGPGEFQRAHDEYATEMKALGLQRGVSGSGRKYRPFAEKAAEMDEQCKRAAAAEADAVKAKVEAEKAEQARAAQWADEFGRLKRDRLELEESQRLLKIEQGKVRTAMLRQEVTRRVLTSKEADLTKRSAHLAASHEKAAAALAEVDRIRAEAQRAWASVLKVRAHADTLMAMVDDLETARLIQARDAVRAQVKCVDDAVEDADLDNQLALLDRIRPRGR